MNPITELLATLLDALSAARQAADLAARLKAWWYTTRQPGIEDARLYWPYHSAAAGSRHNGTSFSPDISQGFEDPQSNLPRQVRIDLT